VAKPSAKKPGKPRQQKPAGTPPAPQQVVCRRCGRPGPVGEDGFCAGCEKALEQACL
jgi:hypothetical protein